MIKNNGIVVGEYPKVYIIKADLEEAKYFTFSEDPLLKAYVKSERSRIEKNHPEIEIIEERGNALITYDYVLFCVPEDFIQELRQVPDRARISIPETTMVRMASYYINSKIASTPPTWNI